MSPVTKYGAALKALDEAGHGLARIATLSAVDADGDTYAPGAFGTQWAKILAAHDWQTVPLGKARIYESGDEALAELHINLGSETAREWHAALKFDLDRERSGGPPIQEWSYGFRIEDSAPEDRNGRRVRVLKRVKVHEVSPVVLAAGVNTGTLAVKPRTPRLTRDDFKAGLAAARAVLAAQAPHKAEAGRLLTRFLAARSTL